MARDYSLVEVIEAAIQTRMDLTHTAIPGRVVTYYPARQTADVQPTVAQPLHNELGEVRYLALPTLPDVPVSWPSGGGFFASFPLAAGDPVMLIFSESGAGEYLTNGQDSQPIDTRRHSLGYPIAIPGGARPDTKLLADASGTAMVIGQDGGTSQITITGSDIEIGKGAADFVALASKVQAALNLIATHVHTSAAAGSPTSPSPTIATLGPVAATLVKAK